MWVLNFRDLAAEMWSFDQTCCSSSRLGHLNFSYNLGVVLQMSNRKVKIFISVLIGWHDLFFELLQYQSDCIWRSGI